MRLFALLLVPLVGFVAATLGHAQSSSGTAEEPALDRVQFRPTPQDGTRTLDGMVVDLQAKHVELKLPSGSTRRIPRAEIVSVKLLNQPSIAKAERAAADGKFADARDEFAAVVRMDVPHWMKRHAAARRIQSLRVLQQHRLALADFVNLAKDDPEQILVDVVPVVWTSPLVDSLMDEQIKAWLVSDSEWERLVGASLGLMHPATTSASQQVFAEYVKSEDSAKEFGALESIARAQLWRLPQNRSPEELRLLQTQLAAFPVEARAGALLVLGKLWKAAGKPDLAADSFLQIAVLYPEQHDLVLLGLEAAYYTLRELDREEAARVGQWLVQRHPSAAQTDEIRKELGL
jgi:tetratricopeptide (TPR) repeat protein